MGVPPSEGARSKEAVKSFIEGGPFQVFVYLQHNYLVPFPTPDLPWDPPLGAHSPLSQDGSRSEGFWEEQDSYGLVLPLDFRSPRSLSVCVVSLVPRSGAGRDPLILCSNRVLPPSVPATTIIQRCL